MSEQTIYDASIEWPDAGRGCNFKSLVDVSGWLMENTRYPGRVMNVLCGMADAVSSGGWWRFSIEGEDIKVKRLPVDKLKHLEKPEDRTYYWAAFNLAFVGVTAFEELRDGSHSLHYRDGRSGLVKPGWVAMTISPSA